MKNCVALLLFAVLLVACKPSDAVKAKQATVTTRWKWTSNSGIGTPKGLIVHRTGDDVSVSFVYLKDGDGFVVDKTISMGKYFPEKRLLFIPPGPMGPLEMHQYLQMNGYRIEVAYTPDAQVLKGRWLGQGGPEHDIDFVRVQD